MSSLGPEAEELVRAGREALRPAQGDRERILEALRARVGGPNGIPSGDALAKGASGGAGGWLMGSVIVAAALGLGGLFWLTRGGEEPTLKVGALAVASSLDRVEALPPATPARDPAAAPPPQLAPAAPSAPIGRGARSAPSRGHDDSLKKEVAVLSKATIELRAGRYASALRLLDEHERTFPSGALLQERIAARVQALCGQGRVPEAKAQLKRLSPGSLQEHRAREACGLTSGK